jgi:hypothetical protein
MIRTLGEYLAVPTVKDRIQVLLEPEDYSNVVLLAKEEQRSNASMGAVLIREAIKERVRKGLFVPPPSDKDEALRVARLRRKAKQEGLPVNELVKEDTTKQDKAEKLLEALSNLLE